MFKSAEAGMVVDKVRSRSQGVMAAVFVKPGDMVKKGRILGHTELDATKLQLDLAKCALEAKANVTAAEGQAEAWTVTREEIEEAVRRRNVEKTRLEWATAMEKMYRATHQVQLDAEKTQSIQYEYWKEQYEKRFFLAPVDGVVSEVLVKPGENVNIAAHAFTISNDNMISIPVTVPSEVARATSPGDTLPVRPVNGKPSASAQVDSMTDNPGKTGEKILRLLVPMNAFPATIRSKLVGMKFDVLVPMEAGDRDFTRTAENPG